MRKIDEGERKNTTLEFLVNPLSATNLRAGVMKERQREVSGHQRDTIKTRDRMHRNYNDMNTRNKTFSALSITKGPSEAN